MQTEVTFDLFAWFTSGARAAFIFGVFFVLSLIVDKILARFSKRFDTSTLEVFTLLSNSQKTILLFIGAIFALSELGFEVTALVAGLGLTGFALGFALKDAISNLVAGFMIAIYKPVELGDHIEITGTKGRIIDLNLRYITILGESNEHLIPNSMILTNKLTLIEKAKPAGEEDSSSPAAPQVKA